MTKSLFFSELNERPVLIHRFLPTGSGPPWNLHIQVPQLNLIFYRREKTLKKQNSKIRYCIETMLPASSVANYEEAATQKKGDSEQLKVQPSA